MADRISKEQFEEKVLNSKGLTLVEFYSDSCIACKQLSPVLAQLGEEFLDKLMLYKVNINFENEIAQQLDILSAPTIIIFKDGEEANRLTGFVKLSTLKEILE